MQNQSCFIVAEINLLCKINRFFLQKIPFKIQIQCPNSSSQGNRSSFKQKLVLLLISVGLDDAKSLLKLNMLNISVLTLLNNSNDILVVLKVTAALNYLMFLLLGFKCLKASLP